MCRLVLTAGFAGGAASADGAGVDGGAGEPVMKAVPEVQALEKAVEAPRVR